MIRHGASLLRTISLAAVAAFASPAAFGGPATIDFELVPPVLLNVGGFASVGSGFTLTNTGAVGLVAIDTGSTPPDAGATPPFVGDLASQHCAAGLCASNGSIAAYSFLAGEFTLAVDTGTFDATSFDAAIASNTFSKATRFSVTGYLAGTAVASEDVLLLPSGYGLDPSETTPSDAASGAAESFQTISLTGFTGIDSLTFANVGNLVTDPAALTSSWGFLPEFAIDNINVALPDTTTDMPEPATIVMILTGIGGLAAARRRKSSKQFAHKA